MRPLITLALLAAFPTLVAAADNAQAPPPSAELAKKCRELAVKAHPPATAGSKTGTAAAEREYFLACVRKGGKTDE